MRYCAGALTIVDLTQPIDYHPSGTERSMSSANSLKMDFSHSSLKKPLRDDRRSLLSDRDGDWRSQIELHCKWALVI